MMGYAGSRDYVGTPQSPQKTPHMSTHPTEDPLARVLCGLLVTSISSQPTQNSYERVVVSFSVGCVDRGVGSSAKTVLGPYVIPRPSSAYPVIYIY